MADKLGLRCVFGSSPNSTLLTDDFRGCPQSTITNNSKDNNLNYVTAASTDL